MPLSVVSPIIKTAIIRVVLGEAERKYTRQWYSSPFRAQGPADPQLYSGAFDRRLFNPQMGLVPLNKRIPVVQSGTSMAVLGCVGCLKRQIHILVQPQRLSESQTAL